MTDNYIIDIETCEFGESSDETMLLRIEERIMRRFNISQAQLHEKINTFRTIAAEYPPAVHFIKRILVSLDPEGHIFEKLDPEERSVASCEQSEIRDTLIDIFVVTFRLFTPLISRGISAFTGNSYIEHPMCVDLCVWPQIRKYQAEWDPCFSDSDDVTTMPSPHEIFDIEPHKSFARHLLE